MNRLSILRNRFLLGGSALILAVSVIAHSLACPIDKSSAYFTGSTKIDSVTGKLLKEYKCARGHTFMSVS